MTDNQTCRTRGAHVVRGALASAAFLVAAFASEAASFAAKTPAVPVPQSRWGSLQPAVIIEDATAFDGHTDPRNGDTKQYFDLGLENGYLFVSTGQGFEIFDVRTNPGNPGDPLAYIYGWFAGGAFPYWAQSDKDWYIRHLSVPAGVDSVVALGMEEQGFAVVNTSSKTAPTVSYQRLLDTGAIHAFTAGGEQWAYALGRSSGEAYRFNMTAASRLTRCLEEYLDPALCSGVYFGKVTSLGSGNIALDGVGSYLVTGRLGANGTVRLWDVSSPGSPLQVGEIAGGATAVAMWQAGSNKYLASLNYTGRTLSIYDVSCVVGGCGPLTALSTRILSAPVQPLSKLKVSTDSGKSFLYVGSDDLATCEPQREFLYDVSSPSQPTELTPQTDPAGYWGWYYMFCDTGFNLVGPNAGQVYSGYLYRAANSILDAHRLAFALPPVANFSWSPSEVYPNTPVTFTDTSSGAPTSWSWTFGGGIPGTASVQNPSGVIFESVGAKSISLQAFNGAGDGTVVKSLQVLDPMPQIGSVAVTPAAPTICQPVTFTANNVTGAPTLGYSWSVTYDPQPSPPTATGTTSPSFVWNTTAQTTPGNYTGTLVVSNGSGSATKSAPVTLAGLATLPADNGFTPTNDAFTAGTVQFHVNVAGATEWAWDFDDDANPDTQVFGAFSTDPVAGPNPVHAYTTIGVRSVRVKVKNCVNTVGATSAPLSVNITQITPLISKFSISGCFPFAGICEVTAGTTVNFNDDSSGAEKWDYDWDGDGSFEDADNTTARTSHIFQSQGTFASKLRVKRGASEQNTSQVLSGGQPVSIKVNPGQPPPTPSLSIAGASSGSPNQSLSFSASATNCTPNANGWSWNAAGGTLDGSGANVTITWSTTGTKFVSVTNSSCTGATGTRSVTIQSNTSTLTAAYTYLPTSPIVGQAVAFDGSTSTGGPESYVWDFGDQSAFGSGVKPSHTFAAAGTYNVTLNVTKVGNCPPAPFCESSAIKAITVGTGEPPLAAAFDTDAPCTNEFGLVTCTGTAGKAIQFTDASTGSPTSHDWDFGDGTKASGTPVSHTFATVGTFQVNLMVKRGATTSIAAARTFIIAAAPKKTVALPWIAQTTGALVQSSDLYVHNPSAGPLKVRLRFFKRGTPEASAPEVVRDIAAGATLYAADALEELFGKINISGFVMADVLEGDGLPVMTSFNTTFQSDSSQFGQTVSGVTPTDDAEASLVQHLIGLSDNGERQAIFGVANPGLEAASYRLRFFDAAGLPLGTPSDVLTVAPTGMRQFQTAEIRSLFGLTGVEDYRVEIEKVTGPRVIPFAGNLRVASEDPAFVSEASAHVASVAYLVGLIGKPGLGGSLWQSDVVLANAGTAATAVDLTFTPIGNASTPTAAHRVTLAAGATERLADLLDSAWSLTDAVGVLTVASVPSGGPFTMAQGESYDNSNPAKRFGQSMAAMTPADATAAGRSQSLVGLRQNADFRSVVWLFNPDSTPATYDLIYRGLDGTVLGRIDDGGLAAGRVRQLAPSQHPLPAAGVPIGFTLEIRVKSGSLLGAAQVINNRTNDPSYLRGVDR